MLKRFTSGLFRPKGIASFRHDPIYITLLFIIALVIITLIPKGIYLASNNYLDYDDKRILRSSFRNTEIPYKIENFKLVSNEGNSKDYFEVPVETYLVVIITDKSIDDLNYQSDLFSSLMISKVVLAQNGVYYSNNLMYNKLFDYSQYSSLQDVDLAQTSNDNSEIWDTVFTITNEQINNKTIMGILGDLFTFFLIELTVLLLLSLLITWLNNGKVKYNIRFMKHWQLIIYIMTPYIIGNLLFQLTAINTFNMIGIVITIIYAFMLNQELQK